MPTAIISTHKIFKKFKEAGFNEQQAETITNVFEENNEEILKKIKEDTKNTKILTEGKFLYEIEKIRSEIQKSKNEMLIWLFGMLTTFTGIIFAITKFVK